MRDAFRSHRRRREREALKLEALRARLQESIAALERGDYVEVDDAELAAFLDRLTDAPATLDPHRFQR